LWYTSFYFVLLQWPSDEDYFISAEAKDLVDQLLVKDPLYRLGSPITPEDQGMNCACFIKEHVFFEKAIEDESRIDWDALLQDKACFVPEVEDENDTSYFDDRSDRYNYKLSDSDGSEGEVDSVNSELSSSFGNFERVNTNTGLNLLEGVSTPRSSSIFSIRGDESTFGRLSSREELLVENNNVFASSSNRSSFDYGVHPFPREGSNPEDSVQLKGNIERARTISAPAEPLHSISAIRQHSSSVDKALVKALEPIEAFTQAADKLENALATPTVEKSGAHLREATSDDVFDNRDLKSAIRPRSATVSPTIPPTSISPTGSPSAARKTISDTIRDPVVRANSPLKYTLSVSKSNLSPSPTASPKPDRGRRSSLISLDIIRRKSRSPRCSEVKAATRLALPGMGESQGSESDGPESALIQRRLSRRLSSRSRRASKEAQCPLGCEKCIDVNLNWDPVAGFGFSLRCETVRANASCLSYRSLIPFLFYH
jgi:hypothetical protein